MDRKKHVKIYLDFIRPLSEYGDVWGKCPRENSDLLKKVQIDAVSI